jgi:hypothetical protein
MVASEGAARWRALAMPQNLRVIHSSPVGSMPHTYTLYCGIAIRLFVVRYWSPHSAVGITMYSWLDGGSSFPGRGNIFFFSLQRPDRLWGPPNFLSNRYLRPISLGGKTACAWSWQLNSIYFRGRELWRYTSTPHALLHGVVLNYLRTWATSSFTLFYCRNRDSSVRKVTRLRIGWLMNPGLIPVKDQVFNSTHSTYCLF